MDCDDLRQHLRDIIKDIVNVIVEEMENEISLERENSTRIWERKWISRRNVHGASYQLFKELSEEDPQELKHSLRLSRAAFDFLLSKVGPMIQREETFMRPALPIKVKLEVILYMLATGSSQRPMTHLFRLSKSSISNMMPEVCEAIYEVLKEYIKVPSNHDEWKTIEHGFRSRWNFPGCCGAIDGKHITMKAPFEAGSYYYNYKHQNSIVLMAVVDDDYNFSYIDIGCNGRISDGGVFRNCRLSGVLEEWLPANHCIVGDNAFPLKTYLMKPYGGGNLITSQKVFNYMLPRARRIVENAFGILVSRFRIFEKPLPYSPDRVTKIVKACCALHNWLRKTSNNDGSITLDVENTSTGEIIPGSWRGVPSDGLLPIARNIQNHSSQNAREVRDNYANYFVGEGSLSWQLRMIH